MRNYIYFKGGSFGDLLGLLVNNGQTIPKLDQTRLKTFDLKLDSLPNYDVDTIVGHNISVLNLGLVNYQIVISDPTIRNMAANRFAKANELTDISNVLVQYYPKKLYDTIKSLSLEKQTELLEKNYKVDIKIDAIQLDLSCILDMDNLILLLKQHFDFDQDEAKKIYKKWYIKQEQNNFYMEKSNA